MGDATASLREPALSMAAGVNLFFYYNMMLSLLCTGGTAVTRGDRALFPGPHPFVVRCFCFKSVDVNLLSMFV